jgi:peptidoglycan-associated lipoprotein
VRLLPGNEQQQFRQDVKDIHFDFDRSDLGAEDGTILASDAEWLKAHPDVLVTLAGEADERGDIVDNVALSDRRAITTRDAVVELGVSPDRILFATGWGKLYPCAQNPRRVAGARIGAPISSPGNPCQTGPRKSR